LSLNLIFFLRGMLMNKLIIKRSVLTALVTCSVVACGSGNNVGSGNSILPKSEVKAGAVTSTGSSNAKSTFIKIGQANVLDNYKNNIAMLIIKDESAASVQLYFSNISLPKGAYIEISNSNRTQIQEYGFQDFKLNKKTNTYQLTTGLMPEGEAIIKVIYPKQVAHSINDKVIVESYILKKDTRRSIVGQDERVPSVCLKSPSALHEFYKRSRSVGVFSWGCTTWAFSPDNYMLTNQHCVSTDSGVSSGSVTFNYLSETCSPETKPDNSVTIKSDRRLVSGSGDATDYTLYTLDEFDYKNAKIKDFFGGLRIKEGASVSNTPVYISQYGNGGIMPQKTAYWKNQEPCKIVKNPSDTVWYNCDTQGGSSGSAVLSQLDNSVIALHYAGGGNSNVGVSSDYLWSYIKPFISTSTRNQEVLGLETVLSSTVEFLPKYNDSIVAKRISEKIKITPFSDTLIKNYGDEVLGYSVITVKAKSVTTGNVFDLNYRLQLKTACGTGNIASTCNSATSSQLLVQYFKQDNPGNLEAMEGVYSWIPLQFVMPDSGKKGGLLIKIINNYDAAKPEVKNITLSESNRIYISKDYGQNAPFSTVNFLVHPILSKNLVDGPTERAWTSAKGPSTVKVKCDNGSQEEIIIYASRNSYVMHSGMHSGDPKSVLELSLVNNKLPCNAQFMIKAEGWHDTSLISYLKVDLVKVNESSSLQRFDYTPNAAIPGYNNIHLKNVTPEKCADACLNSVNSNWCVSFDYYKRSQECDLSDKRANDVGGLKTDYPGNPYDHYSLSKLKY
jgi:V8-like Glu-specific endopeptidase